MVIFQKAIHDGKDNKVENDSNLSPLTSHISFLGGLKDADKKV